VAPGTIVHVDVDQTHPLAYGLPAQTSALFASSAAYDIMSPDRVKTPVRYASSDLLVSGLLHGGDAIAGKAAVVSANVDAGRVILFGFRIQHRAQTLATFRLLFNAIYTSN
jgi:hypothetical protein